jgi:hypothetical protein
MQPGTLHFVLTTENTIVAGQHFFTPATLARSLCSHVVSLFGDTVVTNATHECFLSTMQSFASWWFASMKEAEPNPESLACECGRKLYLRPSPDLCLLTTVATAPEPHTSEGQAALFALTAAVVFRRALSYSCYYELGGEEKKSPSAEDWKADETHARDKHAIFGIWANIEESGVVKMLGSKMDEQLPALLEALEHFAKAVYAYSASARSREGTKAPDLVVVWEALCLDLEEAFDQTSFRKGKRAVVARSHHTAGNDRFIPALEFSRHR